MALSLRYDVSVRTRHSHTTRIGKRNQVTIPAAMLRRLGVGPGDTVEVDDTDGEVTLRKAEDPIARAYGIAHLDGDPVFEVDELEELIARGADDAAVARHLRTVE